MQFCEFLATVFICGITFYQGIYYSSVSNGQTLLQNKTRVCRTMRTKSELPDSCRQRLKQWWKGDTTFWQKGLMFFPSSGRMIAAICGSGKEPTGQKNRKIGQDVLKLTFVTWYNLHMKGVDWVYQHLSYYTFQKTVEWLKNVVMCLINCGLFNLFRIYCALNMFRR